MSDRDEITMMGMLERHMARRAGSDPDKRFRSLPHLTLTWLKEGARELREAGFSDEAIGEDFRRLMHPNLRLAGFTGSDAERFWNNNPGDRSWIMKTFNIPEVNDLVAVPVVAGVRPQASVMDRIIAWLRRLRYYFPI